MSGTFGVAYVLALEPSARGLCFVAFDKDRGLLDWGGFEARASKNARCRQIARRLSRALTPRHIVLENGDASTSTRRPRIRELLRAIAQDATDDGYAVVRLPRLRTRQCLCAHGTGSKDDMAAAVCTIYPELSGRLPERRRTWQSEHYSLALFEAAALGMTFFDR